MIAIQIYSSPVQGQVTIIAESVDTTRKSKHIYTVGDVVVGDRMMLEGECHYFTKKRQFQSGHFEEF